MSRLLDHRERHHHRQLTPIVLRLLPPVILVAGAIAVWQAYTVVTNVPDYLLPGPLSIWQATIDQRDLLWQNAIPTFKIAAGGYFLALGLGLALALAIRYSRVLALSVYPIIIASQTVPILALAPILLVVFGFTILPKLIIVCLICFFPITVNTVDGLRSVDPELINLMRTLGAGRWRLFRDAELPAALPSIFSGARVAVTFCVVGAIFGEWVGSSEGLGWIMQQEQAQFNTPVIFSAMLVLTVMGIGLFSAVSLVERLALPWYHDERRRNAVLGRGK